jgi:hypothetical protein
MTNDVWISDDQVATGDTTKKNLYHGVSRSGEIETDLGAFEASGVRADSDAAEWVEWVSDVPESR